MQVGLHMSYFLVISRFQQPKKQSSPFPFVTLSSQEGGGEAWQVTAERAG